MAVGEYKIKITPIIKDDELKETIKGAIKERHTAKVILKPDLNEFEKAVISLSKEKHAVSIPIKLWFQILFPFSSKIKKSL